MCSRIIIAYCIMIMINGYKTEKECLLYLDSCLDICPHNMHPYHTRCDRDTMSQRTCDQPFSYPLGFTCGWSRCDCDGDLLLDESSGICMNYFVCQQNMNIRNSRRRKYRLPKKLRIKEVEDDEDLLD